VIQKSWENGIPAFLMVFVFIQNLNYCIDDGGAKRGFHFSFIQVVAAMVLWNFGMSNLKFLKKNLKFMI